MLRRELLDILAAPGTGERLRETGDSLVAESGVIFPVVDAIPSFVEANALETEKRTLQKFYDDFGWKEAQPGGGLYRTQAYYGFTSPTLVKHRQIVNRDQRRLFGPPGRYFLDCASGAVAVDEYLEYSREHEFHVCVDLSLRALQQARGRLRERGLYAHADAARLPFVEQSFSNILSSHTIYHMPPEAQALALREFHRVLEPGGKCVVFYNVGEHSLIGRVFRPLLAFKRARSRKRGKVPAIYSFHYPHQWFDRLADLYASVEVHVYRLLPNQVMKYMFPGNSVSDWLGDRFIRALRRFETRDTWVPYAQYVTVVLTR